MADQQLMAQALSGETPPSDVAQLQASPNFPQNLSPAALAALFLVPGTQKNWDSVIGRSLPGDVQTVPGQTGRYNILQGDTKDTAKPVGTAILEYRPTAKEVYVSYMQGGGPSPVGGKAAAFNDWAHSLGTKELRSLLRSTAETFPQAEKITGDRISGAKAGAKEAAIQNAIQNNLRLGNGAIPSTKQSVPLPRTSTSWGAPGTKLTDLW